MLYELSSSEVELLRAACVVAQDRMAENAESAERCANNRYMPKSERVGATRVAKWYREREAAFDAVRKALDKGREIITLERANEALER